MFENDKTTFISEIESGEFVDTSIVQSTRLEVSDTKFQGKLVVSYVAMETENRRLKADGTQVATSISWENLEYVDTMGSVDCYKWQSGSGKSLSVYRFSTGDCHRLGCGCEATVMVQDEVAHKDADFSQFLGRILNKRGTVKFKTGDNHLKVAIGQVNLE